APSRCLQSLVPDEHGRRQQTRSRARGFSMRMEQEHRAEWPQALRRYLGVSIVANLVWEMLQLPLYTLWTTGTRKQQAFAVVHCTVGDAMIAGLSILVALALFARTPWPGGSAARVY